MKEILEHLINKHGVPMVLREINLFGRAKYDKFVTRQGKLFMEHKGSESWLDRELTFEEQKEHDLASAYLLLDLEWCAAAFERRVSQAGLSDKEKRDLELNEELQEAQSKIDRIKNRMEVNYEETA